MVDVYPVLLAGGVGSRLWPLSRGSYPKQFSNLFVDKTLFQFSALRLTSSGKLRFAPHTTVTNSDFRFIVLEQFKQVGLEPGHILIEPEAKNTASAILAASLFLYSQDPKCQCPRHKMQIDVVMLTLTLTLTSASMSTSTWTHQHCFFGRGNSQMHDPK